MSSPLKPQDRPRVSVIMRSKNSGEIIGQALAGLYSQSFQDFELLVVDSGSRDNTLAIVERYPARLMHIPAGSYFPGIVLNQACRQARGELLVFQNSDVVPLGPDCLGRLVAAFDDEQIEAAFARQAPRPEAHTWVRRDYAASFPERGEAPQWLPFSLPLAAMRRSAWKHQPFYDSAWASEDTAWGEAARRRGATIRYVPEATVMHSHNYTLRQIYGRKFVEGEADAFIYGGRASCLGATCRLLGALANDVRCHARAGDWRGLLAAPARRIVAQWAHLRGRRLGEQRRDRGDTNTQVGQQVILARHDAR